MPPTNIPPNTPTPTYKKDEEATSGSPQRPSANDLSPLQRTKLPVGTYTVPENTTPTAQAASLSSALKNSSSTADGLDAFNPTKDVKEQRRGRGKKGKQGGQEPQITKAVTRGQKKAAEKKLSDMAWRAYAESIKEQDKIIDEAERMLEHLPNANKALIHDDKIYLYAFNSTGRDSAGKAKAFEILGYPTTPDGYRSEIPQPVREQGEHLKQEILDKVKEGPSELRVKDKQHIESYGLSFDTDLLLQGVGTATNKKMDFTTGWIDKREPDRATTKGRPELTTFIPKGKKK